VIYTKPCIQEEDWAKEEDGIATKLWAFSDNKNARLAENLPLRRSNSTDLISWSASVFAIFPFNRTSDREDRVMNANAHAWTGDWQLRVRTRLHALGCETVRDLLDKYPAEPYVSVAKRLGDDVAAVQIGRLQLQEIRDQEWFRHVAMDCLARELVANLPDGWAICSPPKPVPPSWTHLSALPDHLNEEETRRRIEWQTAGAYSHWVCFLRSYDPGIDSCTEAVWNAFKALSPPAGWLPSGAADPLIVRAFDIGWPTATSRRKIKRQAYSLLCPNCTAVLSPPEAPVNEIVCRHCGEQIELV
jgi:hypothetical protein